RHLRSRSPTEYLNHLVSGPLLRHATSHRAKQQALSLPSAELVPLQRRTFPSSCRIVLADRCNQKSSRKHRSGKCSRLSDRRWPCHPSKLSLRLPVAPGILPPVSVQ